MTQKSIQNLAVGTVVVKAVIGFAVIALIIWCMTNPLELGKFFGTIAHGFKSAL